MPEDPTLPPHRLPPHRLLLHRLLQNSLQILFTNNSLLLQYPLLHRLQLMLALHLVSLLLRSSRSARQHG